jgi:hypothetical protein
VGDPEDAGEGSDWSAADDRGSLAPLKRSQNLVLDMNDQDLHTASTRLLLTRIDAFMAEFERGERSPDRWEYACTMTALVNIGLRDPESARCEIDLAQTPHELRPPKRVSEVPKFFDRYTIADLRQLLVKTKIRLAH